jgi:dimethylargininase
MIRHAIVRTPGPDAVEGLTTQSGPPVRLEDLLEQHAAYCRLLETLGIHLIRMDPLPGFPDAYFVEDTAVVTPEIAVITRPGAPERRGEEQTVARILGRYRTVKAIQPPGTLDGGDVMIAGRQVFIGLSGRTDAQGADQLVRLLTPWGYRCTRVPVNDGLHLKSSVAPLDDGRLLILSSWAPRPEFDGCPKLLVQPAEAHACNTLAVNNHLITPAGYPGTRAQLEALDHPIHTLDTHAFRRMDGGLSCLSLRF